MTNHLLDIESLDRNQVEWIMGSAESIMQRPERFSQACTGKLMVNLFYEPSTRTRISFEIAARRLGMDVVNMAAAGSSVVKGESLLDTFKTLQAMAPDAIVLRHPDDNAPAALAEAAQPSTHLINAGDGSRAHPTQALLDGFTLKQHFGDLGTLKVLVAGDLSHSRVTRSWVALLKKLGVAEIRLASPGGFGAGPRVSEGTKRFDSLDEAIQDVNAVMMLRIQRERIKEQSELPADQDYHRAWGLTPGRLSIAAPDCIVMHPGPMNRGVEIASSVADGPQSVILEQVRNGVYVRMAVLLSLLKNPG